MFFGVLRTSVFFSSKNLVPVDFLLLVVKFNALFCPHLLDTFLGILSNGAGRWEGGAKKGVFLEEGGKRQSDKQHGKHKGQLNCFSTAQHNEKTLRCPKSAKHTKFSNTVPPNCWETSELVKNVNETSRNTYNFHNLF